MKKLLLIGLSFFILCGASFVEGLEDLPMPQNWHQVDDETISFGNAQTNFVEIYIESESESFEELISFYKKTLPQLGWKYMNKNGGSYTFEREKESLSIKNIDKMVRITVKSSN